jgi:hypothetical protein
VLPVMLLAGAVLVDLAVTGRVPGWLAALPVTAAVAAAAVLQSVVAEIPPWNWAAVPVVAVGFALLWGALDRVTSTAVFTRWQQPAEAGPPSAGDTPVPAAGSGASAP